MPPQVQLKLASECICPATDLQVPELVTQKAGHFLQMFMTNCRNDSFVAIINDSSMFVIIFRRLAKVQMNISMDLKRPAILPPPPNPH